MRRTVALAALALLAACASEPPAPSPEDPTRIDFDRPPPHDWPQLAIEVYDVSREEMAQACAPRVAGCATGYWCQRRCVIYVLHGHLLQELVAIRRSANPEAPIISSDQARSYIIDHEQSHCLGYDHPDSTRTRDAWERARANANDCGPGVLPPRL